MKKTLALTLLCLGSMTACSPILGKPSGAGALYSDVRFNEESNEATVGAKQGESCATGILGLVATGDASAATAARQAGITRIATVDGKNSNILGIVTKYCVVVTGE
jgi:hypothetical protein